MGRLLLWLLLSLVAGAGASAGAGAGVGAGAGAGALDCSKINGTFVLKDTEPNGCDATEPVFGYHLSYPILDFSQAGQATLDQFLGKKTTSGQLISTIYGAIVMTGNSAIQAINLASIESWQSAKSSNGEIFINIWNNPKLKEIKLPATLKIQNTGTGKVQMLIYNNPQLAAASTDAINKSIVDRESFDVYIQSGPNECRFQDPFDDSAYKADAALLPQCKSIKGDLILSGGTLTGDLTLDDDACLKLIGVNMNGINIVANAAKGKDSCRSGGTSEISKNEGLCGEQFETVEKYFAQPPAKLEIDGSCTISCTTKVHIDHKYHYCKSIDVDGDIGHWFTDEYQIKRDKLEMIKSVVTITSPTLTTLNLPSLLQAKELKIVNNDLLTDIELPNLNLVTQLNIRLNKMLTLEKINALPAKLVIVDYANSAVECPSQEITKLEDLRFCTHILGDLILKQIPAGADLSLLHLRSVQGCLKMESTFMEDIPFVKTISFQCTGKHVFTNNPRVCPEAYFSKSEFTVTGKDPDACPKICHELNGTDCENFIGELKVDSVTQEKVKNLKKIKGKLIIDGTSLSELEFPKLEQIFGSSAPVLQITNNPNLKSLKMPLRPNVTMTGGLTKGLVKIDNNPKLDSNLAAFLPAKIVKACADPADPTCAYAQGTTSGTVDDSITNLLLIIAGSALVLLLLVGGGILLACCLYKKKKNKQKMRFLQSLKDYEFSPLIDQRFPNVEDIDMLGRDATLILEALLSQPVISWRRWLTTQQRERELHFDRTFPYNRMYLFGHVFLYYESKWYTLEALYGGLKKMFKRFDEKEEKSGKGGDREAKPKLARKKGNKWPEKLTLPHLLHIGSGITKKKMVKGNITISVTRLDGPKPKETPFHIKSSKALVTMKNKKKKEEIEQEVELTEIILPDGCPGNLHKTHVVPWTHVVYAVMKYEKNIVVHTDSTEYLLIVNMVGAMIKYFTLKKLEIQNKEELKDFVEGIYMRYGSLFGMHANPKDAWSVWLREFLSMYEWQYEQQKKNKKKVGEKEKKVAALGVTFRNDLDRVDKMLKEALDKKQLHIFWHRTVGVPLPPLFEYQEALYAKQNDMPRPDFEYGSPLSEKSMEDMDQKTEKTEAEGKKKDLPLNTSKMMVLKSAMSVVSETETGKDSQMTTKKEETTAEKSNDHKKKKKKKSKPMTKKSTNQKSKKSSNQTETDTGSDKSG